MTDKSIQENILAAIAAGQVKMRPRWYFVLRTVLLVVGTLLVFLTSVFFTSFIIFALRQSGTLALPGFGGDLPHIFTAVPWIVVLLAVVFIALLQILIKKYSFGYGRPLLLTALVILILAIAGGFFLEMTPLHRGLFDRAEDQRLPLAGGFYRNFGEHHFDDVTIGQIIQQIDAGYKIHDRDNIITTIIRTEQTQVPGNTVFQIGDMIVVFGNRTGDTVTARSIMLFTGEPHYRIEP